MSYISSNVLFPLTISSNQNKSHSESLVECCVGGGGWGWGGVHTVSYRAKIEINALGVHSGSGIYLRWIYLVRIMCHNCILVLFRPFYLNLYI